mgnify:CR=1 FL=1
MRDILLADLATNLPHAVRFLRLVCTLREGFGCGAAYVERKADLEAAIQEMLDYPGPYVLDVATPYTEHVLPMIPGGMTVRDIIKE